MLSSVLNTLFAFAFTALMSSWIIALLVDRCCGKKGISSRQLLMILALAMIAGVTAGIASWNATEFRQDQLLEIDYERQR